MAAISKNHWLRITLLRFILLLDWGQAYEANFGVDYIRCVAITKKYNFWNLQVIFYNKASVQFLSLSILFFRHKF